MHTSYRKTFARALCGAVLLVSMAGCDKSATATAANGEQVSDADVTQKVDATLRQDETLKQFPITVVTTKGDVRLTGEVANASQHALAVKIARETVGAHSIHDEITVK